MPDNQFNPGPYGSASTSYSSASGPNPQSAPSAATTWAPPGQNAGILPPTDQKSLISKPGLGLSVFWLVLGLITLAVGAGLASLNLTDATLPSLSSFSPGTSKSAQLEANRTYAFYAASTKLDSARKTSCVVSGPDGYSPTVTNANSSEELQLNRSYYKVATFSPNKSGSYSFACSNPNLDRADVFAIADITDTTTVTSSNDLIYARIFVGAGAFLGLVGLGLGIFGVIALIRKLKARRNFTDGLPAQGGDSASASSGAFNGYVPTTPGQAPLGYRLRGLRPRGRTLLRRPSGLLRALVPQVLLPPPHLSGVHPRGSGRPKRSPPRRSPPQPFKAKLLHRVLTPVRRPRARTLLRRRQTPT